MDNVIGRVLISEEQLQARIRELGEIITKDYQDKELVMVCILRGSVLFFSDLARRIDVPMIMDFMSLSSYEGGTSSTGRVRIIQDLNENVEGRDVLIVEDIVDSGLTLHNILNVLNSRNPNSIKVCSLLDKPHERKKDLNIDYVGFTIENEFVLGYGLDYKQKYRNVPFVGVINPDYI